MSDLFVLAGRGPSGFSRDSRFAPADEPPPAAAADPSRESDDGGAEAAARAFADGHAQGYEQARLDGEEEERAAAAIRQRFAFSFQRLDAELAEHLRSRLEQTVVALCEAVLAPMAIDREALARRVKKAAALFQRIDEQRVFRLHPEDIALLGGMLPDEWPLVPDPALPRGTLRVETTGGGVEDGPHQWRAALIEALHLC